MKKSKKCHVPFIRMSYVLIEPLASMLLRAIPMWIYNLSSIFSPPTALVIRRWPTAKVSLSLSFSGLKILIEVCPRILSVSYRDLTGYSVHPPIERYLLFRNERIRLDTSLRDAWRSIGVHLLLLDYETDSSQLRYGWRGDSNEVSSLESDSQSRRSCLLEFFRIVRCG